MCGMYPPISPPQGMRQRTARTTRCRTDAAVYTPAAGQTVRRSETRCGARGLARAVPPRGTRRERNRSAAERRDCVAGRASMSYIYIIQNSRRHRSNPQVCVTARAPPALFYTSTRRDFPLSSPLARGRAGRRRAPGLTQGGEWSTIFHVYIKCPCRATLHLACSGIECGAASAAAQGRPCGQYYTDT